MGQIYERDEVIMSTFTEISIVLLGVLNFIVFLFAFITTYDEDDGLPSILCQRYLWEILDDININFAGKLILCTLFTPFTILYMIMMIILKIICFVAVNAWKLFCLLFQKK